MTQLPLVFYLMFQSVAEQPLDPTQLVEQQLLPQFIEELKTESKAWHKGALKALKEGTK